jgi:hypothetical protein
METSFPFYIFSFHRKVTYLLVVPFVLALLYEIHRNSVVDMSDETIASFTEVIPMQYERFPLVGAFYSKQS